MNPLLDLATIDGRAEEARRAAEAVRLAHVVRRGDHPTRASSHPVRHAVGASLVRAGLRLLHA